VFLSQSVESTIRVLGMTSEVRLSRWLRPSSNKISGTVERLQAKELRGVARFEVAKWFLEKNPPVPKSAKKQSQ